MPRISDRARLIRELEGLTKECLTARLQRMVWDEDKDPVQDSLDVAVVQLLQKILRRSRYLYRTTKYRKGSAEDRFNTDLSNVNQGTSDTDDSEGKQPWLNNLEFLHKYRMSRSSFQFLLNKIKDHPIFHTGKKEKQAPPVPINL
jgi:hypothetical protein